MNNRKKLYISIGVILSVMTLVTIFAFRQEAQTNNSNQVNQQEQDDPPTPIQLGVMSEKQRKHSRVFPSSGRNRKMTRGQGDVEIISTAHTVSTFSGKMPPPKSDYFRFYGCQADLIVIAGITNKNSQLTENSDWVFTDYELNVFQILKNNTNLASESLKNITLTAIGGAVAAEGRRISLKVNRAIPLRVNREYILFLKYNPILEAFELIGQIGSIYGVSGGKVFFPGNIYGGNPDSVEATADLIRGVTNNCPNNGGN